MLPTFHLLEYFQSRESISPAVLSLGYTYLSTHSSAYESQEELHQVKGDGRYSSLAQSELTTNILYKNFDTLTHKY